MTENFLCEAEGRSGGDSGDLKGARLLSRAIRWTPSGLKHEADPRRTEQLVRDLLQSSPGPLAMGPSVRAPFVAVGHFSG
eukprot:8375766-Alexandrium_andersonii.AAC.1